MFLLSRKGSDFQASLGAWLLFISALVGIIFGIVTWSEKGFIVFIIGILLLISAYWKGLKEEVEYEPDLEWRWGYKKREKQKLEEQKMQEGLALYEKYKDKY